jgi:hypothetical protein
MEGLRGVGRSSTKAKEVGVPVNPNRLVQRSPSCSSGIHRLSRAFFTGDTVGATQIAETVDTKSIQGLSRGIREPPWPPVLQLIDLIEDNKFIPGTEQGFSTSVARLSQ